MMIHCKIASSYMKHEIRSIAHRYYTQKDLGGHKTSLKYER